MKENLNAQFQNPSGSSRTGGKERILHLPTTVGGNPQGLSFAFTRLGFSSESWTLEQNYFGYSADHVICDRPISLIRREFRRLLALRYVFLFDVVIFNFGRTLFSPLFIVASEDESFPKRGLRKLAILYFRLLQQLELKLLRLNGVVMAVQYQGDDARQFDFALHKFDISIAKACAPTSLQLTRKEDRLKRSQIRLLSKYCSSIFALNPDLLWVLPEQAKFLPYCHIDLSDWVPIARDSEIAPIRIVHAPSSRSIKGTGRILEAVEVLRDEGIKFDFQLIEGFSHDKARVIYEDADIVVDQIYAGWYGGLGLEAMALGKVLVCYIRKEDLLHIPVKMAREIPVVEANEETLVSVLRSLLTMPPEELREIGSRSRAFAERFHDQTRVAEGVLRDLGLIA